MTVKKNVLFVVKRRFINMEKDEENVANVEELSELVMVSRLNAEGVLKNGF